MSLLEAARNGNVEVLEEQPEPPLVDGQTDQHGRTAMMVAAQNGKRGAVIFLRRKRANLDLQDADGRTALMLAADAGHTDIVQILDEWGADTLLRDNDGLTALMLAARSGHKETVKAQWKGPEKKKNKYSGRTDLLLQQWNREKTLINQQNKVGDSALMLAARNWRTDVVVLLKKAKANVDLHNQDGCSALMLAQSNGHSATIGALTPVIRSQSSRDHSRSREHEADGDRQTAAGAATGAESTGDHEEQQQSAQAVQEPSAHFAGNQSSSGQQQPQAVAAAVDGNHALPQEEDQPPSQQVPGDSTAAMAAQPGSQQLQQQSSRSERSAVFTGRVKYFLVAYLRKQSGWQRTRAHGFGNPEFCKELQSEIREKTNIEIQVNQLKNFMKQKFGENTIESVSFTAKAPASGVKKVFRG